MFFLAPGHFLFPHGNNLAQDLGVETVTPSISNPWTEKPYFPISSPIVVITFMVDGSFVGSPNRIIMAHRMPLAGAVHSITETP